MGFSCGIVGLPMVGKTTIFNALTAAGAPVGAFHGAAGDPKDHATAEVLGRIARR